MAITQTLCTVFKTNLLKGLENFNTGSPYVYKIALYTDAASLDANTSQYSVIGEASGTGYIAGGKALTPTVPTASGTTALISFGNVTWNPAGFSVKGALIYNATTNAAVAVLNFGETITTSTVFTITFPTADATNAIIRIL